MTHQGAIRYRARLAGSSADRARAMALRALVFRGDAGRSDADAYDAHCQHLLVEDVATGSLAACCRLLLLPSAREIGASYSAQFYDLAALDALSGPVAELGRFCVRPGPADPDILRMVWAALTRIVDARRIAFLFGCSSFPGTEVARHAQALAFLRDRHQAPPALRPRARAAEVRPFAEGLPQKADVKRALAAMPPLLRSYLLMGGWVSDHAVIDRDLGTLHVFTGLEIAAVPPGRARALRAVAAAGTLEGLSRLQPV